MSPVLSQTPNQEDQIPYLCLLSDRVAQWYSQALDSLFIAFYDSQGYSGGILTCLHMEQRLIYVCKFGK
jgi:hypothetical protein